MKNLDLTAIAETLESLEETIIHKLIDRAQFKRNATAYTTGESGFTDESNRSLFELRLFFQESMDAQFGRFYVPEERPFCRDLPEARRVVSLAPTGLMTEDFDVVNLSIPILGAYLDLLDSMCQPGDDGHYGSSVEHDVYAVQAIARRIHYGALYVAESKYRGDPEKYRPLIDSRDTVGLCTLLTRKEVEDRIIERIGAKVTAIQTSVNTRLRSVVDPAVVLAFYRDSIIPLTKKGEVQYLLQRAAD